MAVFWSLTEKEPAEFKNRLHDAKRMLYGLEGFMYYLEQTHEDTWYEERLCEVSELGKAEMAFVLKLPMGCSAKELYLAMLEASAKLLRIPKYQIYTVDQLCELVLDHYKKLEISDPSSKIYTYIHSDRKEEDHEFKRKKFFDTERFYTRRDHISFGSGCRSQSEEEKRRAG